MTHFYRSLCSMMGHCSTIFFCLLGFSVAAQPGILWQKAMGGSKSEQLWDIRATSDGGYIVVGSSLSNNGNTSLNHGAEDVWVLKLSSEGDIEWQKSFGGSAKDFAQAVQQTADGGYIVVGATNSSDGDVTGLHGYQDVWVLRLSSTGSVLWQKTLGGTGLEYGASIQASSDGGFILAGTTYSSDGDLAENHGQSDAWVVKMSSTGAIEWQKVFGGSNGDGATYIRQTAEGGYLVAIGSSSNNGDFPSNYGNSDSWLFKLNATGELLWKKAYGGSGVESPSIFWQTEDGGVIFAMSTDSNNGDVTGNHGQLDFWVSKLGPTGEIEWKTTLGGALDDRARSVRTTADGGYIVSGDSRSYNLPGHHGANTFDLWVLKFDASGVLQWQRMLGGNSHETGGFIIPTDGGEYIVAGTAYSNDGDVSGNHGEDDFWVLKLGDAVDVQEVSGFAPYLHVTPNPAAQSVQLTLNTEEASLLSVQISDVAGRQVGLQTLPNGGFLDLTPLPNGWYTLHATTASGAHYQARLAKQN